MSSYSGAVRPRVIVAETQPEPPRPEDARPRRSKWWLWPVLVAAIAAAIVYQNRSAPTTVKPAPAAIRTAKVRSGTLERTLRVPGITAAEVFTALMTPTLPGGRFLGGGHGEFLLVLQKLAKAGSLVKKGDIVAEFDRQYMLIRLDDFQALAFQHERNVRNLNAALEVRRRSYEQRIRAAKGRVDKAALDLKKTPILSAIQSERLRLTHEELKAQYQELLEEAKYVDISERASIRWSELDLKQASLELKRAEANVGRMLVRSPIDGLAVLMDVRRGTETAQIQAGDQLFPGQPFAQIVNLRSIVVNALVNQVDAEELRSGMRARVRFEAYPDLELPAHLQTVSAMTRTGGWRATYVRQLPIRLKLEKPDPRVIPNLTAKVDLVLESQEEPAIVPRECVFADSAGGAPYAFVQNASGWEKRDLELGMTSYVEVAVRSGLAEGEVVAAERP